VRRGLVGLFVVTLLLGAAHAATPATDGDALRQLVDRIARGQDADGSAAEELIERVVDPLTTALRDVDQRPLAERIRLSQALGRVHAALRLRLARLTLPEEDRTLLDAFVRRQPTLVESLFADDPEVRLAAVQRIPLEPNTAAGVLLALKLDDWDFTVADAAVESAGRLRDPVLGRNVARRVRQYVDMLGGEPAAAQEAVYHLALIAHLGRFAPLAGADTDDGAAAVLAALELLSRSPLRAELGGVGSVALAAGGTRREAAVPALLALLEDESMHRMLPSLDDGRSPLQTVGDAALLALLHIYDLPPAAFGLRAAGPEWSDHAFRTPEDRRHGVERFRQWHAENAARPAGERRPPSTQSAEPAQP
jgi:hypothetical protein